MVVLVCDFFAYMWGGAVGEVPRARTREFGDLRKIVCLLPVCPTYSIRTVSARSISVVCGSIASMYDYAYCTLVHAYVDSTREHCYAKQPSPKDRYCASLSAMMAVVPRASPRALASRLSYERTLSLRSLSTYWKLNEETGEYQRPIFVAATRQHVGEYLIGLCLCFIRFYGFVSPFCHCCLIFFTCTL
jgi:hypothetical protein